MEADGVDNLIRRVIPKEDISALLDNIGLFNSTVNGLQLNSGVIGESDAEILIGLKADRRETRVYVDELQGAWPRNFPARSSACGYDRSDSQLRRARAAVDIQLIGPNQKANYLLAEQITNRVRHIPGAVDVHVQQAAILPGDFLDVDRTRVQSVGLSQTDVANSVLLTLSSSSCLSVVRSIRQMAMNTTLPCKSPPIQDRLHANAGRPNIPITSATTKTPLNS